MTAAIFYIVYILRGKSKPNIASWLIWIGLQVLNTVTYFDMSQDWFKSANALINMISTVSILAVALFKGRLSGLNKWDISVFGLAAGIALLWAYDQNSAQANMLLQIAVGIGFIPTIRGVWKDASLERLPPWIFFTLGHLLSIPIIFLRWQGRHEELIFPILQVFLNLAVIISMKKPWEIIRYCLAGTVGVGSYFALLYVLTEYACWWYFLSAVVASIVNYGTNLLLHKLWTFKNRSRKQARQQAVRYFYLYLGLTIANLGGLYALTEYAHWWYIAAQIPVSIALTFVGYIISRTIFKTESLL